jgi:hypothetical protein
MQSSVPTAPSSPAPIQQAPTPTPQWTQAAQVPPMPEMPAPPPVVLNALQGLQNVLLQKVPLTPVPVPMHAVFPDRLPELPAEQMSAVQPPPLAPQARSPFEFAPSQPEQPSVHIQHVMTPVAPEVPAPSALQETPMPPQFEQATLADLNAALAYAFSQAATPSQRLTGGAATSALPSAMGGAAPVASPHWQIPPRY